MLINLYFIKITITFHNPNQEKEAYLQGIADYQKGINVCPYSIKSLCINWLEGWQDKHQNDKYANKPYKLYLNYNKKLNSLLRYRL